MLFRVIYSKNRIVYPVSCTEYELDLSDSNTVTLTKRVLSGSNEVFFGRVFPVSDCEKELIALLADNGFFAVAEGKRRGYCGASFRTGIVTAEEEREYTSDVLPVRSFLILEDALEDLFRRSPSDPGRKGRLNDECNGLFAELFPGDGPAASVMITEGNKILYEKGFGKPDLDRNETADSDTFFNIASCSKQFTAVGVLQLAEKGLLSLSDPVKKWFPDFEADFWNRVTISHLLSHSSGVPDKRGYLTRKQLIECDDVLALEYLPHLSALDFEPGTSYEYLNPTFVLCGKLISLVSGLPFDEYMRRNVLDIAGMRRSLYFEADKQERIPFRAHGYERDNGTWALSEYGQETCFATRPDGGLYSSVREFFQWEKALRCGRLLSADTVSLAQSEITKVTGSPYSGYQNRENTYYGYGWFVEPAVEGVSERVIFHTGDNGGFKILTARYPESDKAISVFSARSDYDRIRLKRKLETIIGVRY